MKKLLSILCLFMTALVSAQVNFESLSWQEALLAAKEEKKSLFLYACTASSEPCELLERYTLRDLEVSNFYNDNFINVRMDMDQYPGIEVAENFQITVYPSMLFIDSDETVVHRGCGAMEASEFIALGQAALSTNNFGLYNQKFDDGDRTTEFLMKYLSLQEEACLDVESMVNMLLSEIAFEDLSSEKGFMLIEGYQWNIFSREFQYMLENKDSFERQIGSDRVNDKIFNTYLAQYQEVYEAEELHLFGMRALLKEVKQTAFVGSDTLLVMMNLHYSEITEDWESYADYAVDWVGMGLSDPQELDDIAWKFYLFVADKKKLEIAASWARESVDVDPTPSSIDTYASLLFKNGEKKKAVELAKQALEMATELLEDTDHYRHQLTKFEGKKD